MIFPYLLLLRWLKVRNDEEIGVISFALVFELCFWAILEQPLAKSK